MSAGNKEKDTGRFVLKTRGGWVVKGPVELTDGYQPIMKVAEQMREQRMSFRKRPDNS